ncbi:MAG: C10 family peptidase [Kiritimatiellae bacterium]|nr:C10 family peptidase [Kiritimatiellia bacterium]
MKKTLTVLGVVVAAAATVTARAEQVTDTNDIAAVVAGWKNAQEALGEQLTADPVSVQEYSGLGGTGTYYVVTLEGGGFVVTSGDTSLEPVLAYSKTGEWVEETAKNPLKAMVEIDIAAATAAGLAEHSSAVKSGGVRLGAGGSQSSATAGDDDNAVATQNAAKWARYKAGASKKGGVRLRATAPNSDLRVSPLVKSAWNQAEQTIKYKKSTWSTSSKTVSLYNYYTPNNYVCGCVATMMSQIMRYWEWPKGTNITAIANYYGWVKYGSDDSETVTESDLESGYYATASATTKTKWTSNGRPAFGGTYDWANMPTNFSSFTASSESAIATVQDAIGKLTRDCGIACFMNYGSGGSGAPMVCAHRLVHQFAYANGKTEQGWSDASRDALLASLDAGLPCGFSVGGNGAHAIVADGYGYTGGTLYIHFNMGWGSIGSDTWYTPPNVGSFTSVSEILYNIYPPSKGAPDLTIVSGRVLNGTTAKSGVTVTATNRETGFTTNVTSNAKGIYYFMLPHGFYTFSATSSGSSAKVVREVKICTSDHVKVAGAGGYSYSTTAGVPANIHGLDLKLGTAVTAPSVSLTHRWSFTGNLNDSVGSSTATTIGSNVAVEDGKAKLTGNGHNDGSLNLGTNLLNTDGATIEIWASQTAVRNWGRIFDYGADNTHYFTITWTQGTDFWTDRAASKNTEEFLSDNTMGPYKLGVQYHISTTFERQSDGSTVIRWMRRDAASGYLQRAGTLTITNGIQNIVSPKLLLGNSQYTGDSDANAEYDEVRVWNGVLTDAQLKASALAGPDANLSTLPWNASAVRYVAKAIWQGGSTTPTTSSLANSANWSCTDQNGDAITGVPEARTLVIIPNGTTAFTIPDDYTPAWRKMRIGSEGVTATRQAKKSAVSSNYAAQYGAGLLSYANNAEVSPDGLARNVVLTTSDEPAALAAAQLRYDGWVYVPAAQAGRWTFSTYADDYSGIGIDDVWTAYIHAMGDGIRIASADVSQGWHRFSIIVGDTGGGYGGCVLAGDQTSLATVAVSVNGGLSLPFTSANFQFGSPSGTASIVTLAGDCDLTAVDEVMIDTGAAFDLNGHTLKVNAVSSSYLGTTITNTSATEATLEYIVPLSESGAADNIAIAANVAKLRHVIPETPDAFVKYVESNGSQWLDTEVLGRPGTKAEITVARLNASDTGILGSRNGDERFNLLWSKDGYAYLGYRDTWNLHSRAAGIGDKHTFTCEIAADGTCSMSMDGDEASVNSEKGATSPTYYSLYLFACDNGGAANWLSTVRFYSCRIWQDGVLVRDFTPCVKDGVVALYDAVSGGIFRLGTGTLAAGPQIPAHTYTWVGGASGNISVASNWSPVPAGAFTADDELVVNSSANITVDAATTVGSVRFNASGATQFSGANALTVTQIANEGAGTATFNCPVNFSGTYYVEQTGAVKFPGGATATYPDFALRTASSSDLARTLDGIFTFTADWNVPNLGDGNHPWRIPAGSEVYGQVFTGSESGNNRILYIANGGYACFTTVAIGNNCGDIGIDGFLEATTEVTVGSKGGSNNLGSGGTTGTIKAPCIRKVGGYYVYVKIPNMIVGAGGFGADWKDYDLRFQNDVNITASANFDFLGVYSTSNPKDWNLNLNGRTLTINVPEGLTVTFGVTATASGVVRKKGKGTLIMTDTDKKGQTGYVKDYTGGTFIEEGTVRVAASDQIGTGDVTIYPSARLELAAGVTVTNVVKTSDIGVGTLYMENGSSVALSAASPCNLERFELASGASATITTSSNADAGAVLLAGAVGDYSSRLTVPSGFTFTNGYVMVPVTALALTHRWSFNGNYNDSIGGATATVGGNGGVSLSGGKAILAGGAGAGYLNLGAGVLGTGNSATLELWATNITEASNWAYLFTYGLHDSDPNSFFTLCNRSSGLSYSRTTRNGMLAEYVGGTQIISQNEVLIGMPESMAYHYSVTFTVNGADTVTRWMVRDAKTGFLLAEKSVTVPSFTLADASAAGWMLTLGHNPFTNSNLDLNCGFDEVRVWSGILGDEQLMANAIAGPDSLIGGCAASVIIGAGETFTVPTVGGYGYKTDSLVSLGAGAKIRFDTTGYFGKGLRFKSGGFLLPSGSVLDFVELSDTANYVATMENANTILVQLKSTIPYESTWKGGTPSVAADLTNAANWTSVNAQGATISAAPTSKTTVVLTASALATFSVPAGATVNWGRVLLGGRTATQAGRIAGTPNMNKLAYVYRGISDYTSLGAAEVSSINGNGSGVAFLKNYLVQSQVRFDGWVNVPADKAGRWFINCQFDDAVTLFIDGERVFHDPCWSPAVVGGCFVSEGWHRFTLIAADGGGGYGCHANDTVNGTKVPFRITVNGSLTAFHTFTFGSDSSTVTLSRNCDWRALGALEVMDGLTINLNGHTLAVADITRSSLGASIVNTSASAASLYVNGVPSSSLAQTSGMVGSNILILQVGSKTAIWTGSANNGGNALTPGNWVVRNDVGMTISGGLPDSETAVIVSGDNVNLQIPSGSAFSCASLTISDCKLTADCDWRGLAVTPTITGTADLNGHNLRLNHLVANADSALANSGVGVCGVMFDATAGNYNESSYVDGLANLGTSENAHIIILRNGDDSMSSLNVGNTANVWTEVRMASGTITESGTAQIVNTANAHGVLTVDGADVTVNALNVPNGNNAGTATLNVHSGSLTVTTWTDFGNSASAVSTVNQTGGTVDVGTVRKGNTGNGNFWFGRSNSGTATYNISDGTFTAWGSFRIGSAGSSKGIFIQSGGIVNVMSPSYDFSFGFDSSTSGKYYQTGGVLNTERNIDLRRSGSLLDIGGAVTMTVDGKGVNIATVSGESGEVILREGGVLTTSFIKKGSGTAHATFAGGKIVAKDENNAATFISGIGDVTYADGGLTVDTNGKNVSMVNNIVSNALPGSALVKQGSGTLTVDSLPPVDTVRVEGGTLALDSNVNNSTNMLVFAGGTLDLQNNMLALPSVKVGNGTVRNGRLDVSDKIVVNLADCIARNCIVADGCAIDLSGVTLVIEDPEVLEGFRGTITFIRSKSGGEVIGVPECELPSGWRITTSGGRARLSNSGFPLLIR